MKQTAYDFLRASTHLYQAHSNAVIHHATAALVPEYRGYSDSCLLHLRRAAEALGFNLVPAIPQPAAATDGPTQEADHEVIPFPNSVAKAGAAFSETSAGRLPEDG